MASKTASSVKRRTVTQYLPCVLTADELRTYGDQLAGVVQDIAAEEDRQADVKAQMKARVTELESRKSQLAIKISRREEHRDVAVEELTDYREGTVTSIRTDTGELLKKRELTEDERQQELPVG